MPAGRGRARDARRKTLDQGADAAMDQHDAVPGTVADMVFPKWRGANAKGRATRELILRAALVILIDEGYGAMTMRRVAAQCGLKLGNLTYHYRSRESLVTELFESVLRGCEVSGEAISHLADLSAEDRLVRFCRYALQEIRSKQMTRLFPELWALSNHDKVVFKRVHELYRRGLVPLQEIVKELRPDLSQDKCTALATFITASLEGLTVFAGYEKPFEPWMPAFERIAARSFLGLLKDVTAEGIGRLVPLSSASVRVRAKDR
jgi:AcrR family transcriptional regulator